MFAPRSTTATPYRPKPSSASAQTPGARSNLEQISAVTCLDGYPKRVSARGLRRDRLDRDDATRAGRGEGGGDICAFREHAQIEPRREHDRICSGGSGFERSRGIDPDRIDRFRAVVRRDLIAARRG